MDLSFTRFDKDAELLTLPPDLAVLMVGIAARQAASATAATWARLSHGAPEPTLLAPADGAFNGRVARRIRGWEEE